MYRYLDTGKFKFILHYLYVFLFLCVYILCKIIYRSGVFTQYYIVWWYDVVYLETLLWLLWSRKNILLKMVFTSEVWREWSPVVIANLFLRNREEHHKFCDSITKLEEVITQYRLKYVCYTIFYGKSYVPILKWAGFVSTNMPVRVSMYNYVFNSNNDNNIECFDRLMYCIIIEFRDKNNITHNYTKYTK